jgi:hydrogenase-4 component F
MILDSTALWLYLVLLAPASGAVLSQVPYPRVSERVARVTSLLSLAAGVALLVLPGSGTFGPYFGVDRLSDLFLFLVTAVYASSTWFSRGYLAHVHRPFLTPGRYYGLLGAFALAMLFTLSVSDLGLMWIGVEGTTVASALLIVLERKPTSVEAAWRYTIIASAGLTLSLFALLLLYRETGTLDAFTLAAHPPPLTGSLVLVVGLALVGYGTKVGLFPMHTWLPDAHSEAPSPVSALFSGVLLPTALYAFLRVYDIVPQPVPPALQDLVIAFGLVTALVAAFLLQQQRSFKRMLAYSSMENMGVATVGVGLGGLAFYGALLLLVAHAFAKSSAFYSAGTVLRRVGTTQMNQVRDLRNRLPGTSAAWVLSGLAVTGTPPFGTFFGELFILTGAVAEGQFTVVGLLLLALVVAFLGVNAQLGRMIFLEDPQGPSQRLPEGLGETFLPWGNVLVALLLGLVSLPYLSDAIRIAAGMVPGGIP